MNRITMNDKKEKSFDDIWKAFQKYNKANNLSKSTQEYYDISIMEFIKFKKVNNINEIDEKDITDYKLYLQKKDIKEKTINSYLRGIRRFLYFAMNRDYMNKFKISLIKTKDVIKEIYTDKELKILLEKPKMNRTSFAEYRTWVIINYLLSTGNRSRSVRFIKIGDVNLESGYIVLTETKNKHEQIIPLSNKMENILVEYLSHRKGKDEDWLFCTEYGKQLTKSGFYSAIRHYNLKRGIDKTSPHAFRHTFAKKWIMNGGDIFRLQKLLGHKSLKMVKEYIEIFDEDLKKNFDDYNPLDSMNDKRDFISLKKIIKEE